MSASDLEKWWLTISSVCLAIMFYGVVRAYVLARTGQRTALKYVPAFLLVIMGLAINVSRHLYLVPPWASKYGLWAAGLITAIGVVLLERQWRKEKKAVTPK
jgi:hypothetical protein